MVIQFIFVWLQCWLCLCQSGVKTDWRCHNLSFCQNPNGCDNVVLVKLKIFFSFYCCPSHSHFLLSAQSVKNAASPLPVTSGMFHSPFLAVSTPELNSLLWCCCSSLTPACSLCILLLIFPFQAASAEKLFLSLPKCLHKWNFLRLWSSRALDPCGVGDLPKENALLQSGSSWFELIFFF